MNRRAVVVVAALTLLALVSGCASIPVSGPIQTLDQPAGAPQSAPFDFTPAGPQTGASPSEIVQQFMVAQQATPVTSFVAREFLTTASASTWKPDAETLVFDSYTMDMNAPSDGSGTTATLTLANPIVLDQQGRWLGPAPRDSVVLKLERENGEWRIGSLPNAMMIRRDHFEERFQRFSLFYFDRSGQLMVPESVYLPWGVQAAPTRLMQALLLGPPQELTQVERSYLPSDIKVDLAVVAADGVADVPLTSSAAIPSGNDLERAVAQVATTLGQLSNVSRVRLTVSGQPLDFPGMAGGVGVTSWTHFDPSVPWALQDLVGLDGGDVVSLSDHSQESLGLPGFAHDSGQQMLAVSMDGQRAAVLDGQVVSVAVKGANAPIVYDRGTDETAPHYDLYDNLWLYDLSRPGQVKVIGPNGPDDNPQVLTVQLPDGFSPVDTALSRDGSRWLIAGHGGILVLRVRRNAAGLPLGLTAPRLLAAGQDFSSVAFVSPTRLIAVRHKDGSTDIPFLQADGSPDGSPAMPAPSDSSGLRVFALPATPPEIYASFGSKLSVAPTPGSWSRVATGGTLLFPTFVG